MSCQELTFLPVLSVVQLCKHWAKNPVSPSFSKIQNFLCYFALAEVLRTILLIINWLLRIKITAQVHIGGIWGTQLRLINISERAERSLILFALSQPTSRKSTCVGDCRQFMWLKSQEMTGGGTFLEVMGGWDLPEKKSNIPGYEEFAALVYWYIKMVFWHCCVFKGGRVFNKQLFFIHSKFLKGPFWEVKLLHI